MVKITLKTTSPSSITTLLKLSQEVALQMVMVVLSVLKEVDLEMNPNYIVLSTKFTMIRSQFRKILSYVPCQSTNKVLHTLEMLNLQLLLMEIGISLLEDSNTMNKLSLKIYIQRLVHLKERGSSKFSVQTLEMISNW